MADEIMPDIGQCVDFPMLAKAACPGIYFLLLDGVVVYVGQAVDMRRRIGQHLSDGEKVFNGVSFMPCPPDKLDSLERAYIKLFVPKHNRCHLCNSLRERGIDKLPFKEITVRSPRTRARIKRVVRAIP